MAAVLTKRRTTAAILMASVITLGTASCAGSEMPGPTEPAIEDSGAVFVMPEVTPQACDDPELRAAVEEALASPIEGPHNAMLADPAEVPEDDRSSQIATWQGLSAYELDYQLCLRRMQWNVLRSE
ncbi:hypothetical protein [Salinibacterium sp. ZJ450]|uniref:hypothetical protein n=1 Tax=Salinibacterium sp. ZJ450 TaxID=2708338 RepID=UPI001423E3E1|nr:hypothetical protein [Salinibacterium sp. ZJ450]